jgi:biopolymer transport protein ExbD
VRHKPKTVEGVDVPITPMLDMAFQLLTFFILTYKPMPVEGQFIMNLLPAQPATRMEESPAESTQSSELPAGLRTLPTILRAGPGGRLGRITLGERDVASLPALKSELDVTLKDPTLPFDQALIKVDPGLRYAELITVIDIFSSAFADAKKDPKLSFAELGADEGEGP